MKLGVVGCGSFGRFIVSSLSEFFIETFVFDENEIEGGDHVLNAAKDLRSLVVESDVVVLAVPLEHYENVLASVSKFDMDLSSKLFIDVASVKEESERLMRSYLSGVAQFCCTHPLFGPESAADGIAGHTLIVTHISGEAGHKMLTGLRSTGLQIEEMTATDHDKSMAYAHALTFSVGRALNRLNLADVEIITPSLQKLLDVAKIDSMHSEELFRTVTAGNAYYSDVAEEFHKAFIEVVDDAGSN